MKQQVKTMFWWKTTIFFSVFTIISSNASCQVFNDTIAWIWVKDTAFHAIEGNFFSNKIELNNLLSNKNVVYYEKALPFAKTPELLDIHEVRLNGQGNVVDLFLLLKNNFPDVFHNLSRFEIIDTT